MGYLIKPEYMSEEAKNKMRQQAMKTTTEYLEGKMRREIPVVIRKNGDKFIPNFPVELEAGDSLIITREMRGSQVPDGEKWTIAGYTTGGPIVTSKG